MFFIGFFSNIIPLILLGLGSASMLYLGNHEEIDEKLNYIFTRNSEASDLSIDQSESFFIDLNGQSINDNVDQSALTPINDTFSQDFFRILYTNVIQIPHTGYFQSYNSRGPPAC